jgi:hypothetical protein
MLRQFYLFSLGICIVFLAILPAQAQPANCADHAEVVQRLADTFGETRQSIGVTHDNLVLEVFAAMDTGSWTITLTRAGGPTCLVAAGHGFDWLKETAPTLQRGT